MHHHSDKLSLCFCSRSWGSCMQCWAIRSREPFMMSRGWWMKSLMSCAKTAAGRTTGGCSSLRYWSTAGVSWLSNDSCTTLCNMRWLSHSYPRNFYFKWYKQKIGIKVSEILRLPCYSKKQSTRISVRRKTDGWMQTYFSNTLFNTAT